jgi:hypothetical protein
VLNITEHLFQCLAEESAEIIQAAMKCTRFSFNGHYPDTNIRNCHQVTLEFYDLIAVLELISEMGEAPLHIPTYLFDQQSDPVGRSFIDKKKAKVKAMMGLARERGALEPEKVYPELLLSDQMLYNPDEPKVPEFKVEPTGWKKCTCSTGHPDYCEVHVA